MNRKVRDIQTALIIPCFNEERRISTEYFEELIKLPNLTLIFVNDGSTDSTLQTLSQFVKCQNVKILNLEKNVGKAAAIKFGVQNVRNDFQFFGFLDADGAFAIEDISRSLNLLDSLNSDIKSIWLSRIKMSGTKIERNWKRHYLGRILVTFLTFGISNAPYDTQAGFKIFRNDKRNQSLFEENFKTRWFVDIEILYKLWISDDTDGILEIPLKYWRDVEESKITSRSYFIIIKEFLKLLFEKYRIHKKLLNHKI
jgi:glycosyltransferase involved in cell wall biosynthesis